MYVSMGVSWGCIAEVNDYLNDYRDSSDSDTSSEDSIELEIELPADLATVRAFLEQCDRCVVVFTENY
jgi:hypothetical protein